MKEKDIREIKFELSVGEVARRSGVAVSALHFYEQKGLISSSRNYGNQRIYARSVLRRYELDHCAEQPFETLSGGQQARFQIVLLELQGATMLLLDEPTDNLDLVSAEALELGLAGFEGTVLAVTHDRWFQRGFDRFLVFGGDCSVTDHMEPPPDYR